MSTSKHLNMFFLRFSLYLIEIIFYRPWTTSEAKEIPAFWHTKG